MTDDQTDGGGGVAVAPMAFAFKDHPVRVVMRD
jgi:hypothetical protein